MVRTVDRTEPTHVFVVEQESRPIGWVHLWTDYPEHGLQLGAELSPAGIDIAIGVLEMTGLGLGPVVIRELLKQFVFRNPAVCAVITDPEESNLTIFARIREGGVQRCEYCPPGP